MTFLVKDYQQQGEQRLLDMFSEKPIIQGLLKSYLAEFTTTQVAVLALLDSLNIETATDNNLDLIGKIVGEYRLGSSNDAYRERIKVKIFINSSKGTPNELLEILDLLTESTKIELFEHVPLHSIFYSNTPSMSKSIARTLLKASPVCSHYVGIIHDPNDNALIPCELEVGGGILIDDQNRDLVTEQDYNIAVNYLTGLSGANTDRAILPELGDSVGIRIPPELYTSI